MYLFRSVQTPGVIVGRICVTISLSTKQMKLSECTVIEYNREALQAETMCGGEWVLKCARDGFAELVELLPRRVSEAEGKQPKAIT